MTKNTCGFSTGVFSVLIDFYQNPLYNFNNTDDYMY